MVPYLVAVGALTGDPTPQQQAVIDAAVPLVQERMETLRAGADQLRFLLVPEAEFVVAAEDRERVLTEDARPVLAAALDTLATVEPFAHTEIEAALRAALVDGLGLKPKVAFGPVRVAVTGARISPPLFESLELLGRERSLARLEAALRM
jgi:glutamyl-tRNA synthetase